MNVKGKFRGMTLLTELRKRGSISKTDFEKVSWYLENLDEVHFELGKQAVELKESQEIIERLGNVNKSLEDNNFALRKENQSFLKDLSELDQKLKNANNELQSITNERNELSEYSNELQQKVSTLEYSNVGMKLIVGLSTAVSLCLILKEFFV